MTPEEHERLVEVVARAISGPHLEHWARYTERARTALAAIDTSGIAWVAPWALTDGIRAAAEWSFAEGLFDDGWAEARDAHLAEQGERE